MRKFRLLTALAVLLAGLCSCEKFAPVPENSMFIVAAQIADSIAGEPVPVMLSLTEGVTAGTCTMQVTVTDASGIKSRPKVYINGSSELTPDAAWLFGQDGTARFTFGGMQEGSYSADFLIRRWFHTARCHAEFTVKH